MEGCITLCIAFDGLKLIRVLEETNGAMTCKEFVFDLGIIQRIHSIHCASIIHDT